MASFDFISQSYAKCILTGEHTVLRGGVAIVTPVKSLKMTSSWRLDPSHLQITYSGVNSQELTLIFGGALGLACEKLGMRREDLKGTWHLDNQIQIGGGLGASAAICVSIARFFVSLGKVSEIEVFSFAKSLEDVFHGESSGVDIAATMSSGPIKFYKDFDSKPIISQIDPLWSPRLRVSHSGHKGVTSDCVRRVKDFIIQNPERSKVLDNKMKEASQKCEQAFSLGEKMGRPLLVESFHLAHSCFEEWGLIDLEMKNEIQRLRDNGALAVKPTGSGRGGYILSLWEHQAPTETNLIEVSV